MKVAIASDDGQTISAHFGRTKGFAVFEVVEKEVKNFEYRPNTFTGHARGLEDAGHEFNRHTPILNALSDCGVVIAHGMGMRIYNDLKKIGIEVFVTEEVDVKKALHLFLNDKLTNHPELRCHHKHE